LKTYDEDQETVTVSLGLDKALERHALSGALFRSDRLFNLGKLVLDQLVLVVPIRVVLGQHMQGLGILPFRYEPTGRFLDEKQQGELDGAGDDLNKETETVRPAAGNVESAERDPGGDDGADIPAGVDQGGTLGTITGVSNFSDEGSATNSL
jgi:hypothetical protein